MMSKSVYISISCPISVSKSVLDKFVDIVELIPNVVARYWERGTRYNQKDFDTSDAYLFILPDNKIECATHELPVGLKKELLAAHKSGKNIYIGYISRNGSYNIYHTFTDDSYIRGLAGTSSHFSNWANSTTGYALPKYDPITFEEKKAKVDPGNIVLDSRLVLMLA